MVLNMRPYISERSFIKSRFNFNNYTAYNKIKIKILFIKILKLLKLHSFVKKIINYLIKNKIDFNPSPVYNSELFIKNTIDSVLNRPHKAFELIIINDGSEDNSLDIIKSYDDPRIKLYNKSNSGLIETLNYGIKKCE